VRQWRAGLLARGVSPTMVAKSYRLLRAILNTAVTEDELITSNPCKIKGAGEEKAAERPVLSVARVFQMIELMPDRWRAFMLLRVFASLRWGEITAITRQDLDIRRRTGHVHRQFQTVHGGLRVGPPKSRAGIRVVSFPAAIVPPLRRQLDTYSGAGPDALVFPNEHGNPLLRGNFNKAVSWDTVRKRLGVPGLHLHDLRHTGNTFAAQSGASLRDLMARMGHDSPAAALVYQHSSRAADEAIAAALDAQLASLHEAAEDQSESDSGAHLGPAGHEVREPEAG
jgi:integrase